MKTLLVSRASLLIFLFAAVGCQMWVDDELSAERQQSCVWYPDVDQDGFGDAFANPITRCQPPEGSYVHNNQDCADNIRARFPGAPERCDGIPNDCADTIATGDDVDLDGDDYVVCDWDPDTWLGSPNIRGGGDCDNDNASVRPGLSEICDGLDNDCNGEPDDGLEVREWYPDGDRDGFGDPNEAPIARCADPEDGRVANADDCDDSRSTVFPAATELCDGLDNDCDGVLPDGEADLDGDHYPACQKDPDGWFGSPVDGWGDCVDTNPSIYPSAPELCDGLDDDCNGDIPQIEKDSDGDLSVPCDVDLAIWAGSSDIRPGTDCDDSDFSRYPGAPELCDGKDNDCDQALMPSEVDGDGDLRVRCTPVSTLWPGVLGGEDCDDGRATVYVGAVELCDGLDNDCNGVIPAAELDGDGDGGVACDVDPTLWQGSAAVTGGGDCDDTRDFVYAGAVERCDGLDTSCQGAIPGDELDADGDHVTACAFDAASWQGAPSVTSGGDCDDSDDRRFPGATERCNGLDDDCDGLLPDDEQDLDGDGFVACPFTALSWAGDPYVTAGLDCDDSRASVYPGALEVCDGLLNACIGTLPPEELDADGDGYVLCSVVSSGWQGAVPKQGEDCDDDDAAEHPGVTWYTDVDGDGFGLATSSFACARNAPTDSVDATDCNDNDATIFPAAPELCDGLVNRCGGNLPLAETDVDLDGFVACAIDAAGWRGTVAKLGEDCNDAENTQYPGAIERCDGLDNDCDGLLPANESDDEVGGGDGYVECTVDSAGWDGASPMLGDDCDDTQVDIWPGAPEVWYDGVDQDCDPSNEYDADGDGATHPSDPDPNGGTDCDDTNPSIYPGAPEVWYDGVDQDCDGADDYDQDGDGQVPDSLASNTTLPGGDCDDTEPTRFTGALERCDGQQNDCVGAMLVDEADGDGDGYVICTLDSGGWDGVAGVIGGDDCDDWEDTVYPGAVELCDGQMNDCNTTFPWDEYDIDNDGYVACAIDAGGWDGPGAPQGGDCHNGDPSVYPGAAELCDGQDNDCDGVIPLVEFDDDGDGGVECVLDTGGWDGNPSGLVGRDCDDADASIFYGAAELCDGIDNDCDGAVDEGMGVDADGDGFVPCAGDCDDANPNTWPGAPELCDGLDNDCDGLITDEQDADADGHRVCDGDCDDADVMVHPLASDVCDGFDNDCDGVIDNDCVTCTAEVPTDYATIQAAIDAATDGDGICVLPGTYAELLDFSGKTLGLVGRAGPEVTFLDGKLSGPIITMATGEGPSTVVQGFSLVNGVAYYGGALHVDGAAPTLRTLSLDNNDATFQGGGGYFVNGADVTLVDVTVDNCTSPQKGGGLYFLNSSPTLVDISMNNNSSGYGGSIYLDNGSISLTNVDLSNGTASDGAGAYLTNSTTVWTGGVISGNYANDDGAGIFLLASSATLQGLNIKGNSGYINAPGPDRSWGSGLYVSSGANTVTLSDSIISGNVTHAGGGVALASGVLRLDNIEAYGNACNWTSGGSIYVAGGTLYVDGSWFHNNSTRQYGAGSAIGMDGGTAYIDNSVFNNNASATGGGGAIRVRTDATLFMSSSLLYSNSTSAIGGAIYSYGTMELDNVVVLNNSASNGGGGIHATSTVLLTNVTVSGNTSGGNGGGIYLGGTPSLTNLIVSGNTTSATGGGIYAAAIIPTLTYNDVFNNSPENYGGIPVATGIDGNISVDPVFVDPAPADPYLQDLHLAMGSPLIDAGDPAILDPDGTRSDIGAYGGVSADLWDLDGDGYYEWWLPGMFSPLTSPGMDCDDRDASVYPGNGC